MLIEIFLSYIITKFIDSTLDRGKEDDKQKSDPTEINNNVIINININNGKDHD